MAATCTLSRLLRPVGHIGGYNERKALSDRDGAEHGSRDAYCRADDIPVKSPGSPAATKPDTATKSPATTGSQPSGGLVDINSASAEELDRLPGVGPARAKAIIANRPYNGKDDLTQRKIIPPNVYSQIKDKIIARQGPTK